MSPRRRRFDPDALALAIVTILCSLAYLAAAVVYATRGATP